MNDRAREELARPSMFRTSNRLCDHCGKSLLDHKNQVYCQWSFGEIAYALASLCRDPTPEELYDIATATHAGYDSPLKAGRHELTVIRELAIARLEAGLVR